jgi:hypothetical protein
VFVVVVDPSWNAVRGYSVYSGNSIYPYEAELMRKNAPHLVLTTDWSRAERHEASLSGEISEPTHPAQQKDPNAVLFGYGNYAKTVIAE